jgi:hypothetical protein
LSQTRGVRFDPWFQRLFPHEVDLNAEFVGQFVPQPNEIEQCHQFLGLDEDVEIAVGALFAPRVRAEDPQLADRILPFESRLEPRESRRDVLGRSRTARFGSVR